MDSGRRWLAGSATVGAALLLLAGGAPSAAARSELIKTEGEWVGFDPDAKVVTVKVKTPGNRVPGMKPLRRNRLATFKVEPGGFFLTRTTVAVRGHQGALADIAAGRTVNVYWQPDDEKTRFARKIDVILSDDEVDEIHGIEPIE